MMLENLTEKNSEQKSFVQQMKENHNNSKNNTQKNRIFKDGLLQKKRNLKSFIQKKKKFSRFSGYKN